MKVGIFGVLGIIFVVLKLCSVIAWSWWYVLMPFYLPLSIAVILILITISFLKFKKKISFSDATFLILSNLSKK